MRLSSIASVLLMALMSFSNSVNAVNQPYPFEVQKSGQGTKSIIFIPGFACSGEVWDETKSKFEKDFVCYTLTMAGFAGVPPQPNPTFRNWETGIANYIKENNIEKPIIIGHSMGGSLALALAADYPNLIDKIVVIDALPCLTALMNPSFKAEEKPDCSAMTSQIASVTNEQFYQMQKKSVQRLAADTSKHELIISWSMKSDRKTFAEMYCDFSNTDLREKIKNIQCMVLVLLEEHFKIVKLAVEEQYKNLKNADLQYADKGLHFVMYDNKEWYFTQLNDFIFQK